MSCQSTAHGVDRQIAELASAQHGVVARAQLLDAGVSRDAIDHRVQVGRLHVIHRGVYGAGHRALSVDGHRMGAVLAAGRGAVLSHRGAGGAWSLLRGLYLEVTAPSRRRRRGIRIRRGKLPPDEVTTIRSIPVTTAPRTLLDLAAILRPHQLERAINEADVQGHTDPLSLPALIARYPRRKGVPAIKAILDTGPAFTRSELEARFLALVRNEGLPSPLLNAGVCGFECDCVWRQHRLIVELDGRFAHSTRAAFERDRERDRVLQAAGWRTIRITWRQLRDHPEAIATDLRTMLAAARPRRGRARAAGP